ncbi:MAG: transglutaminase [Deltaproteobacteria bacterium]|nr:transglutaminase [Deltaproteobacteria bacterium]
MTEKKEKSFLRLTAFLLTLLASGLICYKIFSVGYTFSSIIPRIRYDVDISMSFQGFGEPVRIRTYLPLSDERQVTGNELNNSGGMSFQVSHEESGRIGLWQSDNPSGFQQILYTFSVTGEKIVYELDDRLTIPKSYPERLNKYLLATGTIQLGDPVISRIFDEQIPKGKKLLPILKAAFDYAGGLKPMPFKGLTDAATAARLGEASCNGKSRLFIALLRKAGIPSRLVGGLILQSGTKRTSHQWVEVHIKGHWVPFDTLNGYFARIPENYLSLYRTDEALFKHTADINFNYSFKIRKKLTSKSDFLTELGEHPLNAYAAWAAFERVGISLSLLKIIIMIPLGAFIVVIFRNVIGLETFGTFLPALIAAASRETGFVWGAVGFLLVIALVSLIHYPLEKWGILHTPKMSILLISVVMLILGITVAGVNLGLFELSHLSLFPIAVLTITAERFALIQTEQGLLKALKVTAMTLVVVWFCFLAMNSLAMEAIFLAFPEMLLILAALNLWIGRWIGMRVVEIGRFRWLIQ